jgi:CubicO group peptidase (beta-lactamase class C family)
MSINYESIHCGLAELPDAIRIALAEWEIPGIAVAVVTDTDILFCDGFGVRDVGTELPVRPDTLFGMGSTTKSVTTTAIGILVDEGTLDWDKPVRRYLPEFDLQDTVAAERSTLRDLACHRTGMPRHDLVWKANDFSRRDLLERLGHLEPSADFRSTWQYNNWMYMTLGIVIEAVTGQSWEQFVRARIFEPLGMKTATFVSEALPSLPNVAFPHEEKDGILTRIPFRVIDGIGPAGSIHASAHEISSWLRLHLNGGMHDGTRIMSAESLAQLHAPHMVMPIHIPHPEFVMTAYALGWCVQPYRGHNMIWHNGGIDGFYTLISFLPAQKIGVIVLSNRLGHSLPEALTWTLFDRVLGLDPAPWAKRMRAASARMGGEQGASTTGTGSAHVEGTSPSHLLTAYAGRYENAGYGRVDVEVGENGLQGAYGNLCFRLDHYHYDVFTVSPGSIPRLANLGPAPQPKVCFNAGTDGTFESLSMALEVGVKDIVFQRLPAGVTT